MTRRYSVSDLIPHINKINYNDDVLVALNKRELFTLEIKSLLFSTIYKESINNWVDLESIYSKLLTQNIERNDLISKLNLRYILAPFTFKIKYL